MLLYNYKQYNSLYKGSLLKLDKVKYKVNNRANTNTVEESVYMFSGRDDQSTAVSMPVHGVWSTVWVSDGRFSCSEF